MIYLNISGVTIQTYTSAYFQPIKPAKERRQIEPLAFTNFAAARRLSLKSGWGHQLQIRFCHRTLAFLLRHCR